MRYVHAGVFTGESEEIYGGYVHHNDRTTLTGSWKALDTESGISRYLVAVGSAPGIVRYIEKKINFLYEF